MPMGAHRWSPARADWKGIGVRPAKRRTAAPVPPPTAYFVLLLFLTLCRASPEGTAEGLAFFDDFSGDALSRWVKSKDVNYNPAEVKIVSGSLILDRAAARYGYSASLEQPLPVASRDGDDAFAAAGDGDAGGMLLQYEVELTAGLSCGGAYLKLLTAAGAGAAKDLNPDTPYSIMFGPDRCGGTDKVHLILRYAKPDGDVEEKHLREPPRIVDDRLRHVYTLRLQAKANSYEILIDGKPAKAGSLFEDFEPPFLPPELIDDPDDLKPADWVDEAEVPDPEDTKPDDWDEDALPMVDDTDATMPEGWMEGEPEMVPDPSASMPSDWVEEEDGEWRAPLVPNPNCKVGCGKWIRPQKPNPDYVGKWQPAMIPNPAYKGPWAAKKIPNPAFFTDDNPLARVAPVGGVAIEVWTMQDGILFDNVALGNGGDKAAAAAQSLREEKWRPVHDQQLAAAAAVPLSLRLRWIVEPVLMLSASWWSGFLRDLEIFSDNPTFEHGVILAGALSVPLWIIFAFYRLSRLLMWFCGGSKGTSKCATNDDSDGDEPPELVPAMPLSASEIKKGDLLQPDDDGEVERSSGFEGRDGHEPGSKDSQQDQEDQEPQVRQRRPRRA